MSVHAPDEEILDNLERAGLSVELMEDWIRLEAGCLKSAREVLQSPAQLPAVCRRFARRGRLLSALLAPFLLPGPAQRATRRDALAWLWLISGHRSETWFQSVALLDMHGRLFPGGLAAEDLPGHCMSVVCLLDKLDGDLEHLRWLRSNRLNSVLQCALRQERERVLFLQSSRFLRQPSLLEWLSALCARTRILAGRYLPRKCLESQLDRAMPHAAEAAWVMLWHCELSLAFPASHAAVGLFSCALVYGCLLPLDLLRPADIGFLQWSMLFCEAFQASEVPECTLDMLDWLSLLKALEVATSCSGGILRQHASQALRACQQAQMDAMQL